MLRNRAGSWRITAPRPGSPRWTIVVTTSDELGLVHHMAQGKTYDEAALHMRDLVEQRKNDTARSLMERASEHLVRGQLSASNLNETEE